MTEPLEAKAGHRRAPKGAGLTIDGEAVVVARRPGTKSDAEKAAATPVVHASDAPEAILRDIRIVARRDGKVFRKGLAPRPDLVFQAQSLGRFAAPARASGLAIFSSDGPIPKAGRIAAIGALALAALAPAAILLAPNRPVAAPIAKAADGFVIAELETGILPRGIGAVLSVEGVIRNLSDVGGPIPQLRVALADEAGTMQTRPVATGARNLAAGGALGFHSAVAVPAGTSGDIRVDFVPNAPDISLSRKIPAE